MVVTVLVISSVVETFSEPLIFPSVFIRCFLMVRVLFFLRRRSLATYTHTTEKKSLHTIVHLGKC